MTPGDQLIVGGFIIAGVASLPVLFLYSRLKKFAAKEKVHAVEDMSLLWKYGRPPKIAVNDKGLRLHRYGNVSMVLFLAALGTKTVLSIFDVSTGQPVVTTIMVGSFVSVWIIESRVKHYVSTEKVHAVDDVSRLWTFAAPPESVLNERGLRLYQYMQMSATVFFVGIGIAFVGAIFGNDMPVAWGTHP